MTILLSHTPTFLLRQLSKQKAGRGWIYLGKRREVVEKLGKVFGEEENVCPDGKRLYRISKRLRPMFVQWIDDISFAGPPRPSWLFSLPSVKNTWSSSLFLYACYFFLFKELRNDPEKKVDWIIVDSPALGYTLKRCFPGGTSFAVINYLITFLSWIEALLRSIWRFFHFFLDVGKRHLAARQVLGSRIKGLLAGKKNVVLIRQFIVRGFSEDEEDIFKNHFFPGLDVYLQRHGHSPVFLPFPHQVRSYRALFQKIKESVPPIVFAEEFFRLTDYLDVMLTPCRALLCRLTPSPFEGYDFSTLLKEEYLKNTTEYGIMSASLMAKLGKRLVEKGSSPVSIINWNENQATEKGLIYGLRKALPGIKVIGSQPFITPPNYLSSFPSKQDDLLGVTPDKVLVMGPVTREAMQEFSPNLNLGFTPAFRLADLSPCPPYTGERPELLVLIGYRLENALQVLKILTRSMPRLPHFAKVLIKLHPVKPFSAEELVQEFRNPLPKSYTFVQGKLEDLLCRVPFSICGGTGAALELVIRGIPVAILGDTNTLTMNYLDYLEDKALWELCFSEDDLVTTLNRFQKVVAMDAEGLQKRGKAFRQAFFASEGEDHWQNYVDIQQTQRNI